MSSSAATCTRYTQAGTRLQVSPGTGLLCSLCTSLTMRCSTCWSVAQLPPTAACCICPAALLCCLQDAHEFLNYLLNTMAEIMEAQDKAAGKQHQAGSSSAGSPLPQQPSSSMQSPAGPSYVSPFAVASTTGQPQLNGQPMPGNSSSPQPTPGQQQHQPTWVHDIFQGWLVSETRCLQCETLTRREESFMDLSLEIDHNTSLTSCLKQFRCGTTAAVGLGVAVGQGHASGLFADVLQAPMQTWGARVTI